jgi:hypothetical protein
MAKSTLHSVKKAFLSSSTTTHTYPGFLRLRKLFAGFVTTNRMHNGKVTAKRKYWLFPTIKRIKAKKRKDLRPADDTLQYQFNEFTKQSYDAGITVGIQSGWECQYEIVMRSLCYRYAIGM